MTQSISLRSISSLTSALIATIICVQMFEAKQVDIPIECLNETKTSSDYNVFDFFLSYNETQEWLTLLATEYPDKCQLQTIGHSTEGREINAISIYNDQPNKIILIGSLYAREWVGMTSSIYIIHELIRSSARYPDANKFQWIIVPMPNPDGYEYSRQHNRNWMKNRSPQQDGNIGVCLDTNFDVQWGGGISDTFIKTTGSWYRGPAPFSEPETRAIKELMESHTNVTLLIHLQGIGRLIFTPWAYKDDPIPNIDLVHAVANAGRNAIMQESQHEFDIGILSDYAPFQYGTCVDYCNLIGISVCLSLRQLDGTYEMMTDEIIPLGQEALAAIQAMAIEFNWQQWP
uniref:Peptidase_M14 domain-containing protein n=2 Tax=Anopheles funestus TaxID=62324 RepID=A0A4Y0BQ10_ANOFN